jgi:antitoxin CcdA
MSKALKKPTNVSVDSGLLQQARTLKINLSATLEAGLRTAIRDAEAAQWRLENREAIDAYNEQVEAEGVFSDGLRTF